MQDLKLIAKNILDSYYYAQSLNFKNVPLVLIKSISESNIYSYHYAESLNFKNVPPIIIKTIIKGRFWSIDILKFTTENQLLAFTIKYDKRVKII